MQVVHISRWGLQFLGCLLIIGKVDVKMEWVGQCLNLPFDLYVEFQIIELIKCPALESQKEASACETNN